MKTKILLLIANILIFAMPLLATPPESDTIWTKSLFPSDIIDCSFSVTGDSIIAMTMLSGSDTISILETATGNILKKIGLKPFAYAGFTNFNTKSWIVVHVSSEYGGLYIYDYLNEKIIQDNFGMTGSSTAITKDDKFIYISNGQTNTKNITVYDISKGEIIDSISSGYGKVHYLAISPDDKYLAIATGKYKIVYPDPENPEYEEERIFDKIVILNRETKEVVKEFDGPKGTQGKINDMKFSPDGKYLGVAKLDGTVRVYDVINMELFRKFDVYGYSADSGPWLINFSKSSNFIYIGLAIFGRFDTEIYDIVNNSYLKTLDYCSYSCLEVSQNDNVLLACGPFLTYLIPDWITSVKDLLLSNKDTTNIIISKSKNSTYQFKYDEKIQNLKLYNYKGNIQNQSNVLKFNNEIITIETENLDLGVYIISINSNHIPIKILVTE